MDKAQEPDVQHSDHHRKRRGLFVYSEAHVAEIDGQLWGFCFGYKGGSYPGDRYAGDIAALKLTVDSTIEKIVKVVPFLKTMTWIKDQRDESLCAGIRTGLDKNGDYFTFSVIRGMSNGDLNVPSQSCYPRKGDLETFLAGHREKYVTVPSQTEPGLITANLRPAISQVVLYDPLFVEVLADRIQQSFYPAEKKK